MSQWSDTGTSWPSCPLESLKYRIVLKGDKIHNLLHRVNDVSKKNFFAMGLSRLISHGVFQPFPKQALVFTCLQFCSSSLFENTVGKGEIACYSVFYSFGELSAIFIKFEIVVCKPFLFGRV